MFGKLTGYRTSLKELNVRTKHLQRRITMNTLFQIYKGKVHSRTGHEGPEGE